MRATTKKPIVNSLTLLCQNVHSARSTSKDLITSDWETLKDHVTEIKAGNDIKMPVGEPDKLMEALQDGSLKREELAVSAKRLLEMILWLE